MLIKQILQRCGYVDPHIMDSSENTFSLSDLQTYNFYEFAKGEKERQKTKSFSEFSSAKNFGSMQFKERDPNKYECSIKSFTNFCRYL